MISENKISIPGIIYDQIEEGAAIAISISGGKDSQAMLKHLVDFRDKRKWQNEFFAIHADLGRAEWKQSPAHCKKICDELGVDLVTVRRERGDLVARWGERMEKLEGTGKPFWSSSAARYCTSDLKREPINKYLRRYDRVISFEGIRALESTARGKKERFEVRYRINTRKRIAYTFNPILDYTIDDVWGTYGMSQGKLELARHNFNQYNVVPDWWPFHPAYAMGNDRLSCAICVLGSENDIRNGVKHNPELASIISLMEQDSGFTFRQDLSITDIINDQK